MKLINQEIKSVGKILIINIIIYNFLDYIIIIIIKFRLEKYEN